MPPKTIELPVGTIVTGDGLTVAQRMEPPNPSALYKAQSALNGFNWTNTAEGPEFWRDISQRLLQMARASHDLKPPDRFELFGLTVRKGKERLELEIGANTQLLDASHARQVADVLRQYADEINAE